MRRFALLVLAVNACATANTGSVVPLTNASPSPTMTLVWVGRGETERLENGVWQRAPAFDYEFSVEQRRFGDHWESIKHLTRRDPAYDGSAGPRDQTMFFRLDYEATPEHALSSRITSSLGNGSGTSDREFRVAQMTMHADVSRFAPFDTYKIEQTYRYEEGALDEVVSLNAGEKPWVRNHEHATLFAPHRFEHAP